MKLLVRLPEGGPVTFTVKMEAELRALAPEDGVHRLKEAILRHVSDLRDSGVLCWPEASTPLWLGTHFDVWLSSNDGETKDPIKGLDDVWERRRVTVLPVVAGTATTGSTATPKSVKAATPQEKPPSPPKPSVKEEPSEDVQPPKRASDKGILATPTSRGGDVPFPTPAAAAAAPPPLESGSKATSPTWMNPQQVGILATPSTVPPVPQKVAEAPTIGVSQPQQPLQQPIATSVPVVKVEPPTVKIEKPVAATPNLQLPSKTPPTTTPTPATTTIMEEEPKASAPAVPVAEKPAVLSQPPVTPQQLGSFIMKLFLIPHASVAGLSLEDIHDAVDKAFGTSCRVAKKEMVDEVVNKVTDPHPLSNGLTLKPELQAVLDAATPLPVLEQRDIIVQQLSLAVSYVLVCTLSEGWGQTDEGRQSKKLSYGDTMRLVLRRCQEAHVGSVEAVQALVRQMTVAVPVQQYTAGSPSSANEEYFMALRATAVELFSHLRVILLRLATLTIWALLQVNPTRTAVFQHLDCDAAYSHFCGQVPLDNESSPQFHVLFQSAFDNTRVFLVTNGLTVLENRSPPNTRQIPVVKTLPTAAFCSSRLLFLRALLPPLRCDPQFMNKTDLDSVYTTAYQQCVQELSQKHDAHAKEHQQKLTLQQEKRKMKNKPKKKGGTGAEEKLLANSWQDTSAAAPRIAPVTMVPLDDFLWKLIFAATFTDSATTSMSTDSIVKDLTTRKECPLTVRLVSDEGSMVGAVVEAREPHVVLAKLHQEREASDSSSTDKKRKREDEEKAPQSAAMPTAQKSLPPPLQPNKLQVNKGASTFVSPVRQPVQLGGGGGGFTVPANSPFATAAASTALKTPQSSSVPSAPTPTSAIVAAQTTDQLPTKILKDEAAPLLCANMANGLKLHQSSTIDDFHVATYVLFLELAKKQPKSVNAEGAAPPEDPILLQRFKAYKDGSKARILRSELVDAVQSTCFTDENNVRLVGSWSRAKIEESLAITKAYDFLGCMKKDVLFVEKELLSIPWSTEEARNCLKRLPALDFDHFNIEANAETMLKERFLQMHPAIAVYEVRKARAAPWWHPPGVLPEPVATTEGKKATPLESKSEDKPASESKQSAAEVEQPVEPTIDPAADIDDTQPKEGEFDV